MCGIAGLLAPPSAAVPEGYCASFTLKALSHRGPDSAKYVEFQNSLALAPFSFLSHNRLAIVAAREPSSVQPHELRYTDEDGVAVRLTCVANGEVYNHHELRRELSARFPHLSEQLTCSSNDVHLLLPAFRALGIPQLLSRIVGDFAFAIVEERDGVASNSARVWLARDALGVKPLYWSSFEGGIAFASELKALPPDATAKELLAGTFLCMTVGASASPAQCERHYLPGWLLPCSTDTAGVPSSEQVRQSLSRAVRRRLMADPQLPIGVLLSGGLDSSLIALIASQELRQLPGAPPLHTFTIYLEGSAANDEDSADRKHAADVSRLINSVHHEVPFRVEEGVRALRSVIAALETWDVITVRAAVPLYLLCKAVSCAGVKVVLCGEGADELFAGYALFAAYAPHEADAFAAEIRRRLELVGDSELLRVDRASMAWGVEARVPFLDPELLELCMSPASQQAKMSHASCGRIEKWLLRSAFAGTLPDAILYRKKEQFADGVGRRWIPALQEHATRVVGSDTSSSPEQELYKGLCSLSPPQREVILARSRRRTALRAYNSTKPPLDGSLELRNNCARSVALDPDLRDLLTLQEAHTFISSQLRLPPLTTAALATPSKPLLDTLIAASLHSIPFHNLTNLVRPRRPPLPAEIREDMLSGIGGPCIVVNSFFAALLAKLGFEVYLTPGTIHAPDCHVLLQVCVQGVTYFVDVANGKPYMEAVALHDRQPRTFAGLTWRLDWNPSARQLEVFHNTASTPSITFDPQRRVSFAYFLPMVARSRTDPNYGPFLRGIRLACYPRAGPVVAVRQCKMISEGTAVRARTAAELLTFVEQHFHAAIARLFAEAMQLLQRDGIDLWVPST